MTLSNTAAALFLLCWPFTGGTSAPSAHAAAYDCRLRTAYCLADSAVAPSAHAAAQSDSQPLPDGSLAVPWLGVVWQSLPNLTWAACDVSENTRSVIDLAVQQWSYAAANQGVPIHWSELPCDNGSSQAQLRISQASAGTATRLGLAPNQHLLGLTLVHDDQGRICGIDLTGPCVAQAGDSYLFTDNWALAGLSNAQAAKTVAHEFGHAVGLAVPHFCTFDSVMAQDCEPLLPGLGPDDVQSIDALVAYARSYFGQSPLNLQPPSPPPTGTGMTITYPAGYNLVAGPRGTSFASASGPLFSFLPGDSAYETFPSAQPAYDGYGYWAYFPQDTTVQLNGSGGNFYSADARSGQWFLIGNESGTTPMRVIGAQMVDVFDSQSGQYHSTTTLQPGQAAWVMPGRSGRIVVAATTLSTDQLRCLENLGSPQTC